MTIRIARTEFSSADVRRKACQVCDAGQARRLLAIASILDGASRADAAKSVDMQRQTLRDWVHRYKAQGVEGLKDRPNPGHKPLLDEGQLAELENTGRICRARPSPAKPAIAAGPGRRADPCPATYCSRS